MNDVEKLAKNVAVEAGLDPEQKFGSVLLIIMLVGIFINIIRVIQECNKPELSALNDSQKTKAYASHIKSLSVGRGWYTKMRIRKILRQNMPREDYRAHGSALCEAILTQAESLSNQEVQSLIEASDV